jgi:hypothetical protein
MQVVVGAVRIEDKVPPGIRLRPMQHFGIEELVIPDRKSVV